MKKTLLGFLTIFSVLTTYAQTPVSGNIQSNTTWTKSGSPYILSGSVGIPSAYKLTIEPGVVIRRTDDFQILINGAVNITGSQNDTIIFSSGGSIGNLSKPFIEFQKSNLNNSMLKFIKFENQGNVGNNVRIGNESEFVQTSPKNSGTISISRSNLSTGSTATKGYQAANSLNIDSCIINEASIIGYYPRSEKINITNSIVNGSTITSDSYNYGITLNKCKIYKSNFILGCCGANLTFLRSFVSKSNINRNNSGGTIDIQNSTFLNTPISVLAEIFNFNSSKYIINDPTLTGYQTNNNNKFAITATQFTAVNSEFKGLNDLSLLNISNNGSTRVRIENNTFKDFADVILIKDFITISMTGNNFFNFSRYLISNLSNKDFSLGNNYYELKPGKTINDVIFDSNDDLNYGLVSFNPYSTTPVSNASISQPKNVTKEMINNSVTINWNRNPESNLKNYKVYWGYVDEFTFSHVISVASTDTTLVLSGPAITDSIAVTAVNTGSIGVNDQQEGFESWYSPATQKFGVLPLNLVSFFVSSADKKTLLQWETSGEIRTAYFDIEHSLNGTNFTKINSVKGSGNGFDTKKYNYLHNEPAKGINFYRLKLVDLDGTFVYSKIQKIEIVQKSGMSIFPNPSSSTIHLTSLNSIKSIKVVNASGRVVKVIDDINSLQKTLDISNLNTGLYQIYVVTQTGEKSTIAFLKK